jgi:carbamate kinase
VHVVVALGGNALLKRGEPLTMANQTRNARVAASAIGELILAGHQVIVTHGNGPQVGLLALQAAATPESPTSFDVLDAQSEGMIGYMIEQQLMNILPKATKVATLLTQIRVDRNDPAFDRPSKPIGPVYDSARAKLLADERGWKIVKDGAGWRRAIASPLPRDILNIEVIKLLVANQVVVICAGGGGVPVTRAKSGEFAGVEAVIDKDRTSALLAASIHADALLMLTDVDGVYRDWGKASQTLLRATHPAELKDMNFDAGSMAPKVEAAASFLAAGGEFAGIGKLEDALAILDRKAGTGITSDTASFASNQREAANKTTPGGHSFK